METIQQLDKFELLKLSDKALEFTKGIVSVDQEKNWQTIYQLKLDLLVMEQSMIQERKRLMEQAKKREAQFSERLKEIEAERDQFKNQLINHTK